MADGLRRVRRDSQLDDETGAARGNDSGEDAIGEAPTLIEEAEDDRP